MNLRYMTISTPSISISPSGSSVVIRQKAELLYRYNGPEPLGMVAAIVKVALSAPGVTESMSIKFVVIEGEIISGKRIYTFIKVKAKATGTYVANKGVVRNYRFALG